MTLFEEICNETLMLTESVSNTKINKAINGMHPVTISYDDGKTDGKGKNWRLIYPVAYGLTSAGNPVIRAYQEKGDSRRGLTTPPNDREYPKWKYFRVDRIKSWYMDKTQTFDGENLEAFNEGGDDSMSVVYNIAPIGNAKQINRQQKYQDKQMSNNKEVEIDDKPITKADVEGISIPQQDTTSQQPKQKYTARQVIDNIISRLKNSKPVQTMKNLFTRQQNNVDNVNTNVNLNNNNLLSAPDTKPIEKTDVKGVNTSLPQQTTSVNAPTDKPITKDDVENVQDNDLTRSFKDMTNRMNNLGKNEE